MCAEEMRGRREEDGGAEEKTDEVRWGFIVFSRATSFRIARNS